MLPELAKTADGQSSYYDNDDRNMDEVRSGPLWNIPQWWQEHGWGTLWVNNDEDKLTTGMKSATGTLHCIRLAACVLMNCIIIIVIFLPLLLLLLLL